MIQELERFLRNPAELGLYSQHKRCILSRLRLGVDILATLGLLAVPAIANDVTVLVNGSFDAYPPWMDVGSPEYTDIANTMGVQPTTFRWTDNSNIYPPVYSGIYNGGYAFALFINSLGLSPSDNLDVVAHSHGGNVVKIGSLYAIHPIRHLIDLATPINWDLPYLAGGAAASYCQVSSFFDPVQFSGASPYQVAAYSYAQYYAGLYAYYAAIDLYYEDWTDFYIDSAESAAYQAAATAAWTSTKVTFDASNWMFWDGESHSDMHEPPIWDVIKSSCATN